MYVRPVFLVEPAPALAFAAERGVGLVVALRPHFAYQHLAYPSNNDTTPVFGEI